MFSKTINTATALILLVSVASACKIIDFEDFGKNKNKKEDISVVMVDPENVLYADMSKYDLSGKTVTTRTSADDVRELVTLESLLEHGKSVAVKDGQGHWVMTPIKETADDKVVFLSDEMNVGYGPDERSRIKKFLIETPSDYFVVTMVPYFPMSEGEWDYFNMEGFFGSIIYSSVGGEFLYMEKYHPTKGISTVLPLTGDQAKEKVSDCEYISIGKKVLGTKRTSDNDVWVDENGEPINWLLDESICSSVQSNSWADSESGGGGGGGSGIGTGYGITGNTTISNNGGGKKRPSTICYKVDLKAQGDGYAYGSGEYPRNSIISISVRPGSKNDFLYWTGDLTGNAAKRSIKLTKDISATAVFGRSGNGRPCWDGKNEVFFPLAGRNKIAVTTSGKPISGTYGDVRVTKEGKKRAHRGWDIYAEPGTPFYAPMSGTISDLRYKTNILNNTEGDNNGLGNIIGINFTQNGHDYVMFFMHLNYTDPGNPESESNGVGINPGTGNPWAPGDKINAGQLIGCTGATGLAASDIDCPNKHLHVQINNDQNYFAQREDSWDNWSDPSIVFGDILSKDKTGKVNDTIINNPCDELPYDGKDTTNPYMYGDQSSFLYPGNRKA